MTAQKIVSLYDMYPEKSIQAMTIQRIVPMLKLYRTQSREEWLTCTAQRIVPTPFGTFQNSDAKDVIHGELKTINFNWERVFIFPDTS